MLRTEKELSRHISALMLAPRSWIDLGSAIPGRQGQESHGKATYGFEYFMVSFKPKYRLPKPSSNLHTLALA